MESLDGTKIFPEEIWAHILGFCNVINDVQARLVCHLWKRIFDEVKQIEYRNALTTVIDLNKQLKKVSDGKAFIISDKPPQHPQPDSKDSIFHQTLITTVEIKKLIETLQSNSSDICKEAFHLFKETVIDALSDHKIFLRKLSLPKTVHASVNNLFKDANRTIKGAAGLLTLHAVRITGTKGQDDKEGREGGDYGTAGGLQVSINCHVGNKECHNWSGASASYLYKGFDAYLPASLFTRLRENDKVTIPFKGMRATLYVYQYPDSRYYDFNGQFDKAFRVQLEKATFSPPEEYTPPLSEEQQLAMFEEFRKTVPPLDALK